MSVPICLVLTQKTQFYLQIFKVLMSTAGFPNVPDVAMLSEIIINIVLRRTLRWWPSLKQNGYRWVRAEQYMYIIFYEIVVDG